LSNTPKFTTVHKYKWNDGPSKSPKNSEVMGELPLKIKRYIHELDPNFEVVRIYKNKPTRMALHIRLNGKNCLLKAIKKNTSWKKPGSYFRFQKETFIYSRLENTSFLFFHYPRLMHTDGKSFIITEFIKNDPSLFRDYAFFSRAMKALAEINSIDFPFTDRGGLGWYWEKTNRWKFSRTTKTLRNLLEGFIIRRNIPFSIFLKTILFLNKSYFNSTKLKRPILVHRDIFKANILGPDESRIYFIDFEKMGIEKRWVFVDALKIAQAEPLFFPASDVAYAGFPRFYIKLLENFWKDLLCRRPEFKIINKNFKLQLNFCLLGWTLKKLVKERHSPKQEKNLILFLETVVLGSEHHFEDWVKKCS